MAFIYTIYCISEDACAKKIIQSIILQAYIAEKQQIRFKTELSQINALK